MALRAALLMAAACVRFLPREFAAISRLLPLTEIIAHVAEEDVTLQTNALTLINAFLMNAPTLALKAVCRRLVLKKFFSLSLSLRGRNRSWSRRWTTARSYTHAANRSRENQSR
jgi:hypothetical protein